MNKNPQKLIVILGPTAAGKTDLAIKLAKKFNGYIISADSRQIYKDLNIGTAKPEGKIINYEVDIKGIKTAYLVKGVTHFLIHSHKPNQLFSLVDWLKITKKILNSKILNTKFNIPIICGGTGLYISALVNNYILPSGKIDLILRKNLEKLTLSELLKKLKKNDSDTYKKIDKNNKRKVIRALEYTLTNKLSFTNQSKKHSSPYDFLQIGINLPREILYHTINARVKKMIQKGIIPETKLLIKKYNFDLPALSSIGYKQIKEFLNGQLTKEQAINLIQRDTRHYAKRQLTWFKRDKKIQWVKNYSEAKKIVTAFLQK
jgi:tRNA dimethylallyltransferase